MFSVAIDLAISCPYNCIHVADVHMYGQLMWPWFPITNLATKFPLGREETFHPAPFPLSFLSAERKPCTLHHATKFPLGREETSQVIKFYHVKRMIRGIGGVTPSTYSGTLNGCAARDACLNPATLHLATKFPLGREETLHPASYHQVPSRPRGNIAGH
jgi:hypothetical protein